MKNNINRIVALLAVVMIGQSCDKDFLDTFLAQAREWRPQDNGGNSLRYDDCAKVVSFATDPAVVSLAPEYLNIEKIVKH